jgi:hypothetical protein
MIWCVEEIRFKIWLENVYNCTTRINKLKM